mgnify:CR=1 FL=1
MMVLVVVLELVLELVGEIKRGDPISMARISADTPFNRDLRERLTYFVFKAASGASGSRAAQAMMVGREALVLEY